MKKEYMKPSMTVYPLTSQPQILAGSGAPDSDDWLASAPGSQSVRHFVRYTT